MAEIDFMSVLHKATTRDYLARVNDEEFPKAKASKLAKKYDFDYWDGDRRINYGGYKYIQDRWKPVAQNLIQHYNLNSNSKILDVGSGKGFLLYEFIRLINDIGFGALIFLNIWDNCKEEVKEFLTIGNASELPYDDKYFDLALSINTFHNLSNHELKNALEEISRVSNRQYICVESYRNEEEKVNLLYWQVTCEQFNSPEECYGGLI